MCQRDAINQQPGLFECDDRSYNSGVVFTGVVGRQPNLVEGNLRYLFQNSAVDLREWNEAPHESGHGLQLLRQQHSSGERRGHA